MSRGAFVDIEIVKGKTHQTVFRWGSEPSIFKRITALSGSSPVTLTVPDHNLPMNWEAAVVNAPWLTTINSVSEPPAPDEYYPVTVVSSDVISFDFTRGTNWKFRPDAFIRYFTPVDLTGYLGRMQVRDSPGGILLLEPNVVVDVANDLISVNVMPEDTDPLKWSKGVYSLELYDASGYVVELAYGSVILREQVTM